MATKRLESAVDAVVDLWARIDDDEDDAATIDLEFPELNAALADLFETRHGAVRGEPTPERAR